MAAYIENFVSIRTFTPKYLSKAWEAPNDRQHNHHRTAHRSSR
jgi:hypothetical protein